MNPVLSIVIPTYNSSATIGEALNSIINQTFSDLEVVIVDNCSSDNTKAIVEEYSSQKCLLTFFSEKDSGIYDAMNKGIMLSKGTWIYFLGSDDRFYNSNVLNDIFGSQNIQKANVIYGDVLVNGNADWAKDGQIYDGEFSLSKLIEKNICHQALFVKKSLLLEKGGFNTKYRVCADWDMNFRLWAKNKFYYKKTIIAVFRGGNSSTMLENNFTETEKWISIVKHFGYKIVSDNFSGYAQNFLELSNHFRNKHKLVLSFLLKLVYLKHINMK